MTMAMGSHDITLSCNRVRACRHPNAARFNVTWTFTIVPSNIARSE